MLTQLAFHRATAVRFKAYYPTNANAVTLVIEREAGWEHAVELTLYNLPDDVVATLKAAFGEPERIDSDDNEHDLIACARIAKGET